MKRAMLVLAVFAELLVVSGMAGVQAGVPPEMGPGQTVGAAGALAAGDQSGLTGNQSNGSSGQATAGTPELRHIGGAAAKANTGHAARAVPASVEAYLASSPTVKDRVAWVTGDGARQDFDQWTPAMKGRIETFYKDLLAGKKDLGIHLPSEKQIEAAGEAYWTADQAFDMYAAHVAHVIYMEGKHLVPWSITEHPADEIDELVGPFAYCARIVPCKAPPKYPPGIQANRDFQAAPENSSLVEYLGDPRVGYEFLSGKASASHQNLIGATELETLRNITAWARDNVGHGELDGKMMAELARSKHWLEGRLQAPRGQREIIMELGCHSMAKLLVDLARSVNIPLLHARSIDPMLDSPSEQFFSHTHGALIYGWAGAEPRIEWHSDEIYAREGRVCFPIDVKTGALLTVEQANQAYFDELWVSPPRLKQAGFIYKLERVQPGQGWGKTPPTSGASSEDRETYGMMCGRWEKKGTSNLSDLIIWEHDYALCGEPLLHLLQNQVVEAQLGIDFKTDLGGFSDREIHFHLIKDYADRAAAGMKALGGVTKYDRMEKAAEKARGGNLWVGDGK